MDAEKLLKHMAWANQEIFTKIAQLPDEALDAYAVNPEWTAREIIRHIASSATWYGYRLLDHSILSEDEMSAWKKKLDDAEVPPVKMGNMKIVLERAALADAELLTAAQVPDQLVPQSMPWEKVKRFRSTIISQAIHHATEHRAQLISALEAKGFTSINLDHYDLWAYSSTINE